MNLNHFFKFLVIVLSLALSNQSFSNSSDSRFSEARYKAGYAQVDISPVVNKDKVQVLAGGQKLVTKISDPLYAKAVFLTEQHNKVAIISIDTIGFFSNSHEQLTKDVKALIAKHVKLNQLILVNTHTHSGVIPDNKFQQLAQSLSQLVLNAKKQAVLVKIGASTTQFNQAYKRIVNHNGKAKMLWSNPQRVTTEAADMPLGVINIVHAKDHKPFITLVNYNAHPVITMNRFDAVVSADYPGYMAHYIKQNYGSQTLFLPGAAGDINPFDAGTSDAIGKSPAPALKQADKLGKLLASKVIKQIKQTNDYKQQGRLALQSINMPVVSAISCDIKQQSPNSLCDKSNQLYAQINTLTINDDIAIATFPGEYFSDFGHQLRQHLQRLRPNQFKHSFFVGYSNGNLGYVPTLAALKLGGYGAEKSKMHFSYDTGHQHIKAAAESLVKIVSHQ